MSTIEQESERGRVAAAVAGARAWPFEEARKLVARLQRLPAKRELVFETGYGPSGLPHIGTFGEVARTSMVRHAFGQLSPVPTRLICFSDDMDGLRKVPGNIPRPELLGQYIGQPLTRVPDPFGTHESFGHHNNARLRAFLDAFGFEYEFLSATDCYRSGRFDDTLNTVLERYDAVMEIMLPSLREERRRTYSPFLPLCPRTGRVLQVPILERRLDSRSIVYRDPDTGELVEVPVTGGNVKLQWKPDWAMRWTALAVDYEMAGKDLIDSVKLSGRICRALGGTPPDGFNYELFLDENGERISKSRGNGLAIEDWLTYASPESLSLFMYREPRKAKRLYFDVIPRNVDDYLTFLERFEEQTPEERLQNPVWYIHNGNPPPSERLGPAAGRNAPGGGISFSMLLNLVSASNAEDRTVLWGFLRRYAPAASPEANPMLDKLVGYAIAYFRDFVRPSKRFRAPTENERRALEDLLASLDALPPDADGEAIQNEVYEVGKGHGFEALKDWFQALYQVLLGQAQGPRFGSFVALYGVEETKALIRRALAGELVSQDGLT